MRYCEACQCAGSEASCWLCQGPTREAIRDDTPWANHHTYKRDQAFYQRGGATFPIEDDEPATLI